MKATGRLVRNSHRTARCRSGDPYPAATFRHPECELTGVKQSRHSSLLWQKRPLAVEIA